MAVPGVKVSQLSEDSNPTSDDYVLAVDNATQASKKVTMGNVVAVAGASALAAAKDRANHTGTQLSSTISDFSAAADARVVAAAATGTGSLVRADSSTLTGNITVPLPSSASNPVTKAYADALAQGLNVKLSVRVVATSNITLSGEQTIDGVLTATDRVLVIGQGTSSQNGIYVSAAGAWTRATDADISAEVTSGMFTFVTEGTTNAGNGYILTTANPIILNTTGLIFTQFSSAGVILAGTGLTKSGNTISADTILAALSGLDSSTGFLAETASNTFTKRSLAAGSSKVTVANPSGVVGNPTVDVDESNFTGIPQSAVTNLASSLSSKTDKSTLTTKGDVYVASGASNPSRLGIGSNNQVLTADSTQTLGMKWDFVPAAADATTSSKGVMQLAGDLGGTAAAPLSKARTVTKTVGPSGSTADYVCDGVDDDVEIAAALTAVSGGGGGQVILRVGTYNLTSVIDLSYDNIALVGESFGSVTLKDVSISGLSWIIHSTIAVNTNHRYNLRLENLILDGNLKSDVGFTSHNCDGLTVRNCKMGNMKTNGHWAINITTIDPNKNSSPDTAALGNHILVENCEFYNAGGNNDMTAIGHSRNATFRKCLFRDAYGPGSGATGATAFLSASDGLRQNVTIENCEFRETASSGADAIWFSVSSSGGRVINNYVYALGNGSAIQLGGSDVILTGNYFEGKIAFRTDNVPNRTRIGNNTINTQLPALGGAGISISGDEHVISDNQILADGAGISLDATSDNCLISNNKIRNPNDVAGQNGGIELRGTGHVVIGNRIFDDRGTPLMYRGVYLSSATYCTVMGNTITGATHRAIEEAGTADFNTIMINPVTSGVSTITLIGTSDVTGIPPDPPVTLTNATTSNALSVDQNADVGSSPDSDGAIWVENTGNAGIGFSVYSNIGGTGTGNLAEVKVANTAFTKKALNVLNRGTDSAVVITQSGTPVNSSDSALLLDVQHTTTTAGAITVLDASGANSVFVDKNNSGRALDVDQDVTNANFNTGSFRFTGTSNVSDGATYTKQGSLVLLTSEVVETSGTITDTSHLLGLTQSNASSTGNVLLITHSGKGQAILVNHTDTGTAASIEIARSGNSASAVPGMKIAATNGGAGAAYGLLVTAGRVGLTTSSPTAYLHLGAGTATASTAPLKLTAGTNLTAPEAGAIEFDGSHFYGTISSTRYQLDQQASTDISRSIVSVTSSVTVGSTAYTDYVILIGASGAPILPTAVGNTNRYTIKNVHSTNKTLSTTSSQTIDGSTTATIIPNQCLEVISDNANWQII